MSTKLVVGLGNVGRQYQKTRHNLGFAVVDLLAADIGKQSSDFSRHSRAAADVLDCKEAFDCLLVKPTTMMNLSGEAIGALARFYKISAADIWVIYDDVDLPFGQMRVREGGGTAGHNGIKSVVQHLGEAFWRIRLGIANQQLAATPTDYFVLSTFNEVEAEQMPALLRAAADYLVDALRQGKLVDHTHNLISS